MSKTFPWKGGPVAIVIGKDGCLDIRATKPGDPDAMVFKLNELEDLFATLAKANKPVRNKHFVMFGEPVNGRAKAITPEITQAQRDKRTGKEVEYPYAYVGEQLDSFVPLSFTVRARPGYMGDPEPIFMAFSTAWERGPRESIERVTVHAVNEPALKRHKAK